MSKYECVEPGCRRGRETGHALYRTSPKGELFEGKCEEHYEGQPDPLVQAIERRNQHVRNDPPASSDLDPSGEG